MNGTIKRKDAIIIWKPENIFNKPQEIYCV